MQVEEGTEYQESMFVGERIVGGFYPGIGPYGASPWMVPRPMYEPVVPYLKRLEDVPKKETFGESWLSGSGKWYLRIALGHLGDRYVLGVGPSDRLFEYGRRTPKGPIHEPLTKLKAYVEGKASQNARHYQQILGVKTDTLSQGMHFERYRELLTRDGWRQYQGMVGRNFAEFLRPEHRQGLSVRSYLRDTLVGQNVKGLTEPLSQGRYCTVAAKSLGLGFLGWDVFSKTRDAYRFSRIQQDSLGTTLGKTATTFAGQAAKGVICWELGTIGAALGSAVFCVGFWPALLGGVLVGGLFGTLGHKALSKLIPDPVLDKGK